MEYIRFGIAILVSLLIYTVMIGVWMKMANIIGEKLGMGRFLLNLFKSQK